MKTMRRWVDGFLVVTALLTAGSAAFAADGALVHKKGIADVTDANGNPVDLKSNVAPMSARRSSAATPAPVVQRGTAWWPYATGRPPYTAVGTRVESLTEDQIVVNATATLNVRDIEASLQAAPKELILEPSRQLAAREGFYLVKIKGFSRTQDQIDALERAGAVLGEYLNVNTYIAKIPSSSYAAVKALPFVSFVGDYEPAFKISPRIGMEEIPLDEAIDSATGLEKPWVFDVVLHTGVYVNDVLDELARLGISVRDDEILANDAMTLLRVRTVPDAVPAIALIPGVKWIAEKPYPVLLASSTNPASIPMVLQNNGVYTTNKASGWKLWNAGIDGSATSQVVTMMDTGLNTKMEHFSQDTVSAGTLGPSHRKVVGYDVYGGDQCVLDTLAGDGGHGAKTSQHAVGSISNMSTNPDVTHTPTANYDDGIARGAKVYFQDIGDSSGTIHPPADLAPSIAAAIANNSFVQNHSWGAATNSYDTQASNLDTAIFNNPNVVVTVSAGNRGAAGIQTLGSPGTAKNVICVGGNDVSSPDSLFIDCNWDADPACTTADLGSSRGPVSVSNRVKPDIMTYIWANTAVGGEQMASDLPNAMCQTDATKTVYFNYNNIGNEGGTSFAAPEVAGLAALVRDYFQQGFYPTGTASPGNALAPSGSLVKAVILASGEDMTTAASPQGTFINDRYSSDVGYGRANLPAALHIGNGPPFLWVQNNDPLGGGATKSFFYTINGNATPLRVMMTYYDAAGDALQKDADLKVTIGGNVYWGNNLSAGWSTSATATRDHTNNTEGVFLDAAHGLPASGTVQVDVIGFNDPGGMNYSLVVVGDVASQSVKQVSMNQGQYNCAETVKITVNDASASSPVSVTLVSKNAASTTIDTRNVSCSGSGGVFVGTVQTGSGITVVDGGSITATYAGAIASVSATISCHIQATDFGFLIGGGCDNSAAGTDPVTGPIALGGVNEFYNKYMDAGEYSSYTFAFTNMTGVPLTDATVALSFTGPGASKMSALNGPIHVGSVSAGGVGGAVFQLYTDPTTAGLTSVNLNFDITSPANGYTTATRLTQTRLLQANDVVARQNRCSTFNTSLAPWTESAVNGHATNPWRWSGAATNPATVGSENRTDGVCSNSTATAAAMIGNSGITTGSNFTGNADSVLLQSFQPALTGNGPSGQPYQYMWKWHSFYHASETLGATTGVWGIFYNNAWNNPVAPTGDEVVSTFPFQQAYYYQTVFDYVSTWNWETANTGTADVPGLSAPPNQLFITFSNIQGLATPTTYFAYGHEHADVTLFGGSSNALTRRDIAFDNDNFVYDEFYATAQAAACTAGTQVGLVAFDQYSYQSCPSGSAVLSVVDANGVSGMHVTVTSPGTGDSEVVTLTGSAPYFSGTLAISTVTGVGANNGTLLVLPAETINATYTDSSPAGTSTAGALVSCAGGDVVYVTNAQIVDNGDNDGIADNNETVTMDVTIRNNTAAALTNTKVTILTDSPNIDCISDPDALYGTVPAASLATNPVGDRFTFHVAPAVACSDPANPPTAKFTVIITADGLNGPAALQTFTINLDRDIGAGTSTYTQNFAVNPNWTVGVTPPDNSGCGANTYTNDFHWCASCGFSGAGYGAWVGNSAFGTLNQFYTTAYNSSTLYTPVFTAGSTAVTLAFRTAYRTEPTYDGAIVQYQVGAGSWTTLAFTTPAQSATTSSVFCSPIAASTSAWTGSATGAAWTVTNAAAVTTTNGQNVQFRFRLGSDSSVGGANYGGFGVDDVSVTGLRNFLCEPTRNTGLAPCTFCQTHPNGTACDDGNSCTSSDVCSAGACAGTPVAPPAEAQGLNAAADKATYTWTTIAGASRYDVLRGSLSALPVGPGGGDEVCFNDLAVASLVDSTTPPVGTGFWYLSRGQNTCGGSGSYGTQSPGTQRTSTTCP
jgi:hypothetical protein